ncbi:acylneuraminate cytidylyltransferase family protein [Paenibacillus barcinonensis]|uniref:acylneuraminate cytidylyltransferase family protein n=1 Tax=Paenibacillus barcinonensis TaxID=198119 RepID=UPI001C121F78|nr:acylneuraminate cytidylyltransferase family protein [Paenibacillus barcinonensis]MBU5355391.1 acylneuraminate cytidylyltransferase family protein [Paenibacillus barcinonensis]
MNSPDAIVDKQTCLGVIPARGGSKGLPGKNIRLLDGKPLIEYSIEAALKSGCVTRVVVSTDDESIAHVARLAGAEVPFLRPAELATDEAKSIDVLRHAVQHYEEKGHHHEHVLLLQPTSPLRTATDIREAMKQFLQSDADSLQSIAPARTHPYLLRQRTGIGQLTPYLEAEFHLRRQDLEKVYELNGALYLMKRNLLMEQGKIVGASNQGYIMPAERSIDIDTLWDFQLAEWILRYPDRNGEISL